MWWCMGRPKGLQMTMLQASRFAALRAHCTRGSASTSSPLLAGPACVSMHVQMGAYVRSGRSKGQGRVFGPRQIEQMEL